jgi:hypothetical protein
LDREIAIAGLSPNDFLGATLLPSTSVGEEASLPPDVPPRTPKRTRRRTPTEPRADREANRARRANPPRPEPPSTASTLPTRSSFVATPDLSQSPRSFPLEGFRPQGAVVRTLFPPCRRCNNSGRLCVLEIARELPGKTPRCCSPCKSAHATCSSWTKFSNAYEEGNDTALRGFRVAFWEHLGSGSFQPLHPDPRSVDLTQTRA